MTGDERFTWETSGGAATWILPRLRPFNQDTGSVIPEGFAAYCRVFHPDGPIYPDGSFRSWTETAERNGRIAHPNMQFHRINRPAGSPVAGVLSEVGPSEGSFPPRERERLVALLRPETTTAGLCWFCLWEGYGSIEVPHPVVHLPHRNYGLFNGPIDLALAPFDMPWESQSPNLWWPEDRTWFVATEVDYSWTYVGGSAQLIEGLIRDDLLEAMPVGLDDSPFWDGDTVNEDPER